MSTDEEAPYADLIERIRALEDPEPPEGWEARAIARRKPRRRPLVIAVVVVAVLAAAAAFFALDPLGLRASPSAGLEIAFVSAGGPTLRGSSSVGNTLRIHAPRGELRLYRGTALMAACPLDASCRAVSGGFDLEWKLAEPGNYTVVTLTSDKPIPPPTPEGIERDLLDARTAGAHAELRPLVISP